MSLQLGEPAAIVERTGVPVIANFRSADLAAGGRGGPLAAFADWHLLADEKETRACLNLGAVATITLLPAGGSLEEVTAFDVGPGMLLIELWGGDAGGAAALLGKVNQGLLDELRGHPFLRRPPPKSWTWADGETAARLLAMQQYELPRPALMATLVALTAGAVEEALGGQRIDRLLISGGGVYNRALVRELGRRFRVLPTDAYGIGARAKEALAYGVLAFAGWHRIPASLPRVTGARHASVLGQLSLA
jgi:anhydro-N-acetylmuramic acid kinase